MNSEETGFSKPSLKRILSEVRNPTNGKTRFIKYSAIGLTVIGFAYTVLRPAYREYRFRRNEQIANMLYEMEVKQSKLSRP